MLGSHTVFVPSLIFVPSLLFGASLILGVSFVTAEESFEWEGMVCESVCELCI